MNGGVWNLDGNEKIYKVHIVKILIVISVINVLHFPCYKEENLDKYLYLRFKQKYVDEIENIEKNNLIVVGVLALYIIVLLFRINYIQGKAKIPYYLYGGFTILSSMLFIFYNIKADVDFIHAKNSDKFKPTDNLVTSFFSLDADDYDGRLRCIDFLTESYEKYNISRFWFNMAEVQTVFGKIIGGIIGFFLGVIIGTENFSVKSFLFLVLMLLTIDFLGNKEMYLPIDDMCIRYLRGYYRTQIIQMAYGMSNNKYKSDYEKYRNVKHYVSSKKNMKVHHLCKDCKELR